MSVLVVVFMGLMRMMGLMPVSVDIEFYARDILSRGPVEMSVNLISQPERGDCLEKNILVHAEVTERADRHVAADPGKAIEVKNSHGNILDGVCHIPTVRAAAQSRASRPHNSCGIFCRKKLDKKCARGCKCVLANARPELFSLFRCREASSTRPHHPLLTQQQNVEF